MGISKIAICSVFTLLFYITSSATPDPNLGNVLSALYKQAAQSNKALVLVMDKKKNLNAKEKYADQSSQENRNENQNQGNDNRPKTYQHKPVYQYKDSVENPDQGNYYRLENHQQRHYHQRNSNQRVSYEYGYNPQNQKEHNHGYHYHHEPSNSHQSYVSSYERPYHQKISSYETLHDHHKLRSPQPKKLLKSINRDAIIAKSLRHLLRESLQRNKSKARSRNQNNAIKIGRSRDIDEDRDDQHHYHEQYEPLERYEQPQYYYDRHGKLHSHDDPHQHSREDAHQHNHDKAHQHGHDDSHQHSQNEPHQHSHNEPLQRSHAEPHQHSHDESHKHSHDNPLQHSHENAHHHNHEAPHEHSHGDVHEHNHDHGHHGHHETELRQQDRNQAPVTTPTTIPNTDKLDRHSNYFHMTKAFKALRTEISCKSQVLCKKECLSNAACEAECEQVFVCTDNDDANKIKKPVFKSNSGGCDDCNDKDEEEECLDEDLCEKKEPKCPNKGPCKHDKPKDECNKCPKQEEDKGCNDCEQEVEEENDDCDDDVSTKGYGEEQGD